MLLSLKNTNARHECHNIFTHLQISHFLKGFRNRISFITKSDFILFCVELYEIDDVFLFHAKFSPICVCRIAHLGQIVKNWDKNRKILIFPAHPLQIRRAVPIAKRPAPPAPRQGTHRPAPPPLAQRPTACPKTQPRLRRRHPPRGRLQQPPRRRQRLGRKKIPPPRPHPKPRQRRPRPLLAAPQQPRRLPATHPPRRSMLRQHRLRRRVNHPRHTLPTPQTPARHRTAPLLRAKQKSAAPLISTNSFSPR